MPKSENRRRRPNVPSFSVPTAPPRAKEAINGFGDHALFPEEYTTPNDPFTPYELGEDIILDTRPFYRSFSTAAGPGLISSRFVSLFMLGFEAPVGENILVALIAHNHKMAVATHSGFHCSRQDSEGELLDGRPSHLVIAAKVVGAISYTSSYCICSAFGAETVDRLHELADYSGDDRCCLERLCQTVTGDTSGPVLWRQEGFGDGKRLTKEGCYDRDKNGAPQAGMQPHSGIA
ncbi:hypothetical protein V8E53_008120 [Lactarius tabidus]